MDTILREAQRLWPGAGTVTLKQSGQGQSHDIYLVTLSNSSQIIARVARQPDSLGLEKSAIEVLTHIKTSSSNCQIPKVHWHNLDQSREIPPIILEDFVPGRLLSIWNSSISKACQNAFLDSLAQFLLDLWSIEPLTRTTAQPLQNTYPEWLESEVDRGISRCLNRTANWGTASDYLVMRSMIPQIAHGLEFPSRNAIVHGDMNAHNFMVNENLELTGVVDWDWTFEAPLPAVVQFPWFLADVPGWHNDGVKVGETFAHNRDYLVKALEKREQSAERDSTLSTLLANARERQIFQSAITYKDIHGEFITTDKSFQVARDLGIRRELEAYLVEHPESRDTPEVKRIMAWD